jgi:hypothetical protein
MKGWRKGAKAMNILSKVLMCICAGALVAGCSSAPYRTGKGNDHEVVYRPASGEEQEVGRDP